MKKLVASMCLFLFVAGVAQAQDLKFGAKAGLNVASIGGDAYFGSTFSNRIAYHVGVFAEIPVMDKFSVQPELLYSAQGSNFGGFVGLTTIDNTSLNYVNVPVLVKYNVIKGLSAELGPVIGVLLSAKGAVVNSNGNTIEGDVKENYNTIDAGIAVGASYALDSGFVFGLRYNKGITNINNFDNSGSNQNNVFQLWGGYSFL